MPRHAISSSSRLYNACQVAAWIALMACNRESAAKNQGMQVAFLYASPANDGGWSSAHDRARKAVAAELGNKVRTSITENVIEPADAELAVRELAGKGTTLIFGTIFDYAEPISKLAAELPNVRFEQEGDVQHTANLRSYDTRTYEGAYMAGVVAGKMTKSNVLGFVGSFPLPEEVLNVNSFTLGAQSVNAAIKTKVAWVNKWYDPPKEAGEALSLLEQGADVLFQGTNSAAVVQTAETAGKLAIGWASDMRNQGPHAHLASVVINWEPYYRKAIGEAIDGTWATGTAWWGVKEGAVDLVSLDNQIPPDAIERVDTIRAGLKDGSFNPWTGPIFDQGGNALLKQGEKADDELLHAVHVYVQGVEASQ